LMFQINAIWDVGWCRNCFQSPSLEVDLPSPSALPVAALFVEAGPSIATAKSLYNWHKNHKIQTKVFQPRTVAVCLISFLTTTAFSLAEAPCFGSSIWILQRHQAHVVHTEHPYHICTHTYQYN
jgi:hypothetical protein